MSQEQFAHLEQELSTWYGEEYGYQNDGKDRVSVATTCFESPQATAVPGSAVDAGAELRTQDVVGLQSSLERQGAIVRASPPDRSESAAVDAFGRPQLWWATKGGWLEEVGSLLAHGADPNAIDSDGETPLHAAARWGRDAIVELLLSHGANPSVSGLYGTTPLHVSVQEGQVGTIRALLRHRADANARDLFGDSPLHHAVARGNLALVALLLDFGADPAASNDSGTTALHLAARGGNDTLVKLLASHQTSVKAKERASAPPCDDSNYQGQNRLCTE